MEPETKEAPTEEQETSSEEPEPTWGDGSVWEE
jgi:hypothetical protein